MTWWKHLLGVSDEPPPTVKDALDAARAANESTNRALRAVRDYWAGQRATSDRVMDEYEQADTQRTRDNCR